MISIHQFMCRKHVTVFDILLPPIHRFIFIFLLNLRFYSFPKSQISMFWHNPPIRLPSFGDPGEWRGCKVLPRLSPWPMIHLFVFKPSSDASSIRRNMNKDHRLISSKFGDTAAGTAATEPREAARQLKRFSALLGSELSNCSPTALRGFHRTALRLRQK